MEILLYVSNVHVSVVPEGVGGMFPIQDVFCTRCLFCCRQKRRSQSGVESDAVQPACVHVLPDVHVPSRCGPCKPAGRERGPWHGRDAYRVMPQTAQSQTRFSSLVVRIVPPSDPPTDSISSYLPVRSMCPQLDDMRADSPHPIILAPQSSGFNSHLTKVHDNSMRGAPAFRVSFVWPSMHFLRQTTHRIRNIIPIPRNHLPHIH